MFLNLNCLLLIFFFFRNELNKLATKGELLFTKVEVLVELATIIYWSQFRALFSSPFPVQMKNYQIYLITIFTCKGLLCITLGTYSPQSDNFLLRLGNCGAFIFKGLVGCFFVRVVFIKCAKISVCFKR